MAQKLRSIRKLGLNSRQAASPAPAAAASVLGAPPAAPAPPMEAAAAFTTLQLSVTENSGTVATFVEVGSSGDDDRVFNDHELNPGPAQMPMLEGNSYTVVWRGAFVDPGSATLHVLATQNDGTVLVQDNVDISHPPTNSPFTIVVM